MDPEPDIERTLPLLLKIPERGLVEHGEKHEIAISEGKDDSMGRHNAGFSLVSGFRCDPISTRSKRASLEQNPPVMPLAVLGRKACRLCTRCSRFNLSTR